jgi:two-component system chemotaxis response regulator CheY
MKILVVDDDLTCRLTLRELLKRHGATHLAVNGREAVEAMRAALLAGEPFDLICLDITMPVMDGQEALRAIRQIEAIMGGAGGPRTRVVMVSALGDEVNVVKAAQARCDGFLVKPVSEASLLAALRRLNLHADPEAGPKGGPEAGPKSCAEGGPEAGPEAGPNAGPEG